MTISLRDDVMYILLDKINQADGNGMHSVEFQSTDFTGRNLTVADFLGHLDFLNQKHYIDAEFSGNAYARQEDVPDLINEDAVDFRIANTLGAPDGPLPHLITFTKAKLTEKGVVMLNRMKENPPESLRTGVSTPIVSRDTSFLEEVALKAELPDIFDARDLTTVVYRTMRDLMTTEATEAVGSELQLKAQEGSSNKRLQQDIAELWHDDNPIVSWLSNLRPPLKFDADTFIYRIEKEGGLPRNSDGKKVIQAVFSATQKELSSESIEKVSEFLPGQVKDLWNNAVAS